jgi:hypothetical protein
MLFVDAVLLQKGITFQTQQRGDLGSMVNDAFTTALLM